MTTTPITDRSCFPKCIQRFDQIRGICIGGCVRGDKRGLELAHAHQTLNEPYSGWICLWEKELLFNDQILLHEAAHLLVDASGYPNNDTMPLNAWLQATHPTEWQTKFLEIGGSWWHLVSLDSSRPLLDRSEATLRTLYWDALASWKCWWAMRRRSL